MEFKVTIKNAFVLVGFSAAGKWNADIVYPIPALWDKSYKFFSVNNIDKIVGVCLPPRSDHYYYTCGIEIDSVVFDNIEKDMTVHIFPKQKYVVFKHIGPTYEIPHTYGKLWRKFDEEGFRIKEGMPEIEIVKMDMFGKEDKDEYEMEIWIPVK